MLSFITCIWGWSEYEREQWVLEWIVKGKKMARRELLITLNGLSHLALVESTLVFLFTDSLSSKSPVDKG